MFGRSSETTKGKDTTSTGKPSDEDEGIPGYLTDPGLISALGSSDEELQAEVTLVGRSGVVQAVDVGIDELVITAWVVPGASFDDWEDADRAPLPGTMVGRGRPNGEGGFRLKLSSSLGQGILVVALAAANDADDLSVGALETGYDAAYLNTVSHKFVGLVPGAKPESKGSDGDLLTTEDFTVQATPDAATLGSDVPESARDFVAECLTSLYGAPAAPTLQPYFLEAREGANAISKDHHIKIDASAAPRLVHVKITSEARISGMTFDLDQVDSVYCLEVTAPQFDHIDISRGCGVRVYERFDVPVTEKIQRKEQCG